MALELSRWTRRFVDGSVVFTHPEGPQVGTLRVAERPVEVRWAESRAAAIEAFAGCHAEAPDEHFDTVEGESASLARLHGTVEGRSVQESFGLVLTERCHREIRAVVAGDQHFEATHALTRRLAERSILGLGELRRRRFRHDPPAGWCHVARGLISEWTTEGSTIWVLPAKPRNEDRFGAELDSELAEPTLEVLLGRSTPHTRVVYSRHGLRGQLTTIEAARSRWTQVTFSDSRFQYGCLLESCGDRDHSITFEAVWSSVAPNRFSAP